MYIVYTGVISVLVKFKGNSLISMYVLIANYIKKLCNPKKQKKQSIKNLIINA